MDEQLRALEREHHASPSLANEVRFLQALRKAGSIPPRSLEVAAALGHEAAREALGPPSHFLVAEDGRRAALPRGREIQLGKRKPQAEFVINHSSVCREHCKIKIEDRGTRVWDTKSIDGTYINGESVSTLGANWLRSGAELRVGAVSLRYQCEGAFLRGVSVNPYPQPAVAAAGWSRPGRHVFELTDWLASLGADAALRGALAAAETVLEGWQERYPQDRWGAGLLLATQDWCKCPCPDHLARIRKFREDDPLFEQEPGVEYRRLDESLASQDAWAYKEGRTYELKACFAIRALAVISTAESEDLAYELQQGFDGAVSASGVAEVEASLRQAFVPWLLEEAMRSPL